MMVNFFHRSAMHLRLEMMWAILSFCLHVTEASTPEPRPPPCQVVITDIEKVLGLTRTNVELNGLSLEQR